MSPPPIIRVVDLRVYFTVRTGILSPPRTLKAVDGVSFDIDEGEILTLVGESGCGKTTLGKALAGLVKPTSGVILFRGRDVSQLKGEEYEEYRRSVQIVHQDPYSSLNPAKTVYQALSAPLFRWGFASDDREARREVMELLRIVGLSPPEYFINKYPHQLSGGQRQRVVIARALTTRPRVLVADEPITMVDVSLRLGILDLLIDLKGRMDLSVLFITHDFGAARYFSAKGGGRIMVMYLGKIVESGEADSVIREPLHPYTQALLSAVPEPDPRISRSKRLMRLRSLDLPSPLNPPSGCRFHTRCPFYMDKCSVEEPELLEARNGRLVSCFLYGGG